MVGQSLVLAIIWWIVRMGVIYWLIANGNIGVWWSLGVVGMLILVLILIMILILVLIAGLIVVRRNWTLVVISGVLASSVNIVLNWGVDWFIIVNIFGLCHRGIIQNGFISVLIIHIRMSTWIKSKQPLTFGGCDPAIRHKVNWFWFIFGYSNKWIIFYCINDDPHISL